MNTFLFPPSKFKILVFKLFTDEKLTLVDYPSNHEGVFESWKERWTPDESKEIDIILEGLVARDFKHFGA